MLQRLYIKNIALITEADISFDEGLNVLSGETGSGKSVVLDSINFVLGSKADKTMIRCGEQEAMVRAEFFVPKNSEALKKLEELDIESDGEIVITRKMNMDGKGGIKINGNSVTASMLKSVTQHLVDVHGQSEHFFLLSEANQLKVIDGIAGDKKVLVQKRLSELITEKKELKAKMDMLGGDEAERARKLDLLDYQIKEIESAELKEDEYEQLKIRRNLILNTEKIISAVSAARSALDEDGGGIDAISSARYSIRQISALSPDYDAVSNRLESLEVEAKDIAETLSDFADGLGYDENEAEDIENRIELLNSLRKKYGADEAEILKYCQKAKSEYESLSDSAVLIEKYTERINACNKEIYELCKKLTALRKKTAENFCATVCEELKTLNIPDATFTVNFKEYDENSANLSSVNGSDEISFMFSANKGEPVKPLNKVISGGEMSRFMLAVKTVLKDVNGISTYIFDEIDAGISGYTAKTVANKFVTISKSVQILAVSHLPQVCAASDSQFLIYKDNSDGKTFTHIKKLDENSKIDELVRLMGSVMSEAARQHAKELIAEIKG